MTEQEVGEEPGCESFDWGVVRRTARPPSASHLPREHARQRLKNRRGCESFDFEVAGQCYTATIGRHADGTISEIFLQSHKPGSQTDSNARDAGIAASLALQFGCPLKTLGHALLRDSHGWPSTPLGAAVDVIAAEHQS